MWTLELVSSHSTKTYLIRFEKLLFLISCEKSELKCLSNFIIKEICTTHCVHMVGALCCWKLYIVNVYYFISHKLFDSKCIIVTNVTIIHEKSKVFCNFWKVPIQMFDMDLTWSSCVFMILTHCTAATW